MLIKMGPVIAPKWCGHSVKLPAFHLKSYKSSSLSCRGKPYFSACTHVCIHARPSLRVVQNRAVHKRARIQYIGIQPTCEHIWYIYQHKRTYVCAPSGGSWLVIQTGTNRHENQTERNLENDTISKTTMQSLTRSDTIQNQTLRLCQIGTALSGVSVSWFAPNTKLTCWPWNVTDVFLHLT